MGGVAELFVGGGVQQSCECTIGGCSGRVGSGCGGGVHMCVCACMHMCVLAWMLVC